MPVSMGSARRTADNICDAAREAATAAVREIDGREPQLVLAFFSPHSDIQSTLRSIRDVVGAAPVIGCTGSAEFTHEGGDTGGVAVTAVASDKLEVRVGMARSFVDDIPGAVAGAIEGFSCKSEAGPRLGWQGRTLMLFIDGLTGHAEEVIDELMEQTSMQYQLVGSAAGDCAQFEETFVFADDQFFSGGFVVAEVLTERPVGIAFSHGWAPKSQALRVTRSDGAIVQEINGRPAWECYADYARAEGMTIAEGEEPQFLMSNILGIELPDTYKLRVPLFRTDDGAIACAAEVPEGSVVRIMQSDGPTIVTGGQTAANRARQQMDGSDVAGALAFECVATQLHLGDRFEEQVKKTASEVLPDSLAGCAGFGQLARVNGGFSGLMDATSLVCLIPR